MFATVLADTFSQAFHSVEIGSPFAEEDFRKNLLLPAVILGTNIALNPASESLNGYKSKNELFREH